MFYREIKCGETLVIDEPQVVDNEPVVIIGQGRGVSKLRVPFSHEPIVRQRLSSHYGDQPFIVKDCTVESDGPFNPGQFTFVSQRQRSDSIFEPSASFENVVFRGAGTLAGRGFGRVTQLENCWFADFRNVWFYGDTRLTVVDGKRIAVDPAVKMFEVIGRGAGYSFANVFAQRVFSLLEMPDADCQGFTFDNVSAIDSEYGLWARAAPDTLQPGFKVSGCHFNTRQRGIVLRGVPHAVVANSNLFHEENSTSDWFGVDQQEGALGLTVIGNTFVRNLARSVWNPATRLTEKVPWKSTGIACAAGTPTIIGNRGQGLDSLAWLTQQCSDAKIGINQLDGSGGISDTGANTAWVSGDVKRWLRKEG